jgi:hypothetical protein
MTRHVSCARKSQSSLPGVAAVPLVEHGLIRSSGHSLDDTTRNFMERRFEHNFSNVRVHSDGEAAKAARAVNALAFTLGRDIVFGPDRYEPTTKAGRQLLAHELTHVLQQAGGAASPLPETVPSDSEPEREALRSSSRIDTGEPLKFAQRTRVGLARQVGGQSSHSQVVTYDRSQFGGRFSAEIRGHLVVLILGVDVIPVGWSEAQQPLEHVHAFKSVLKTTVEQAWSGKYALQSVCEGGEDKYDARVELLTDVQNPNARIELHPDTPGARSSAGDGGGALQESDVQPAERTRYFPSKGGKQPEQRTFTQVPAAHEFGHLLGLQHIRCPGNEPRCYGLAPDEAMDIMGVGSYVSPRDYAPFQQIMERYGQDALLPPGCNRWRIVEAG